jgi:putative ABC transport system permease protein
VTPADLIAFAATATSRHRLRTGLSLLGVAIGVAAVVLLTGLGEGARRYVEDQFASLGSNLLILLPGRTETTGMFPGVGGVPHDLTIDDALELGRRLPNLAVLAPIAMGNETVAHGDRRRQVVVLGSTREYLKVRELKVARGQFLPAGEMQRGDQVAVLGAKVARELFPDRSAVGRVVRIGDFRVRVIGVLEATGTQIGLDVDDVVVVPVATGMRMFNRTSLFRVLLKTHSLEDVAETCTRALAILKERHQDEEDVTCITQESVVSSLSSILTVLTLALAGIAAISLSVAGVGIMNVMLVSVAERTAEIGLLVAVGARRRQILALFLTEAVLLSALGGAAGLAVGWAGLRVLVWIYPTFPAAAPAWAVAAAVLTSMGVGALFGLLPARRATQLDPIAALAGR